MANTGVSATLTNEDTLIRWNVAASPHANWKITRVGGIIGRTLAVIDDSHFGIAVNGPKNYLFADLHDLDPISVESQIDADNVTIFPAGLPVTDGTAPVKMALASSSWILTVPPRTGSAGTTFTFTGAIIRDGGLELVNNDRHRTNFQIQPDGKTYSIDGNT